MRKFSSLVVALALVALTISMAFVGGKAQAQSSDMGNAQVRVVHASPDAGDVAVFADGSKTLDNFKYKGISELMAVPAGTHKFQVSAAGKTAADAVITADGVKLEGGKHYTVFAVGTVAEKNLSLLLTVDDLSPLPAGKARVRITHASSGAPNVDVVANGATFLAKNLAFPGASDYLTVDAMAVNAEVRATGTTAAVKTVSTSVEAGKIYNFVAIGKVGAIGNTAFDILPIVDSAMAGSTMMASPTAAMAGNMGSDMGNAQVRVVHASPDAGDVAVFADGSKTLDNFKYKGISELMAVPAGTHKFQVSAAGKTAADAVITADGVKLEGGKHYTVFAVGTVAEKNLSLLLTVDDLSPLPAGKARVRITHASSGAPNVDVVANGATFLAKNLAFPGASDYLTVDAMAVNAEVRATGTTAAVKTVSTSVEAGKIYNFVAIGKVGATGNTAFDILPIVDSAMAGSTMMASPTAAMDGGMMMTPTAAMGGGMMMTPTAAMGGTMPGMPVTGAADNVNILLILFLALVALSAGFGVRQLARVRVNNK